MRFAHLSDTHLGHRQYGIFEKLLEVIDFSDDDYMDATCVEAFCDELEKGNVNTDLFRFNLNITKNKEITETPISPKVITPKYLFQNKMSGKCPVFAVEYIFARKIYEQQGGFQFFDLAWHSDIATWMKFGVNGIVTIPGPKVTWRSSGDNITTKKDDILNKRKWHATVDFFVWVKNFFRDNNIKLSLYIDITFIRVLHGTTQSLQKAYCIETAEDFIGKGIRRFLFISVFKIYAMIASFMNFRINSCPPVATLYE